MKTRLGFVSNSSASSFVAAKAYLTEEQIIGIRKFHAEHVDSKNPHMFPIDESEHYISFDLYHIQEEFFNMCDSVGIDDEKVWFDGSDTEDHPWPPVEPQE